MDRPSLPEVISGSRIIGHCDAMRALGADIIRAARAAGPVCILGETGTGKELVAHAVHFSSARAENRFVTRNCGAIPCSLLESELFGHVAGAATGIGRGREGAFRYAHLGTLFLDELLSAPSEMQAAILRAAEYGDVVAVGSDATHSVDVRLVSACPPGLLDEVHAGRFRADLYYRLAVHPLHIPSLRERGRDDVVLLARHFAGGAQLDAAALEALARYEWPGNVRELRNVIARAATYGAGRIGRCAVLEALRADYAPPARAVRADVALAEDGAVRGRWWLAGAQLLALGPIHARDWMTLLDGLGVAVSLRTAKADLQALVKAGLMERCADDAARVTVEGARALPSAPFVNDFAHLSQVGRSHHLNGASEEVISH